MVAKSSRVSRTRRERVADPSQFSRNHFGIRHICEINKTELRTNCDINETLRDNIASKLSYIFCKRCSGERHETVARTSHDYRATILNYSQLCRQRFVKRVPPI